MGCCDCGGNQRGHPVRWLVLTLLLSCVSTAHLHPRRTRWEQEPVIGYTEESLADSVDWAVSQWGWGVTQSGCEGADICVSRGFASPFDKSLGRAFWPGKAHACDAVVYRPTREGVTVAHEIGHCFGMDHSEHSHSVMNEFISSDVDHWYWVTHDDRAVLERIK